MRTKNIAIFSLFLFLAAAFMSCEQLKTTVTDTFKPLQDTADGRSNDTKGVTDHATVTVTQQSVQITTTHEEFTDQKGFLADKALLEAAEQSFRAIPAFAGKTIYLYGATQFYDEGRIEIKVRHPENPAYVDEYTYRAGKWGPPSPVQLSVHDEVSKRLVRLGDMKFAHVATIYNTYTSKAAKIEGTSPLTYINASYSDDQVDWYPKFISGSRERYAITYYPDGTLKDFHRE